MLNSGAGRVHSMGSKCWRDAFCACSNMLQHCWLKPSQMHALTGLQARSTKSRWWWDWDPTRGFRR
jgi:hypothetical protein